MSAPTLARLKAWLADPSNELRRGELAMWQPLGTNDLTYTCLRKHFVTANGIEVSIQQSGTHYCSNENEVEMWSCPHSPLLMAYGDGNDAPYAYVPLEVVAGYIDALESTDENF